MAIVSTFHPMDISPHGHFTPIWKVALSDVYINMHGEQLDTIESTKNEIRCK